MLKITVGQEAVLSNSISESFVRRVADFLYEEIPETYGPVSAPDRQEIARAMIIDAQKAGLETERDIVLFCYALGAVGYEKLMGDNDLLSMLLDASLPYQHRENAVATATERAWS